MQMHGQLRNILNRGASELPQAIMHALNMTFDRVNLRGVAAWI